MLVEQVDQLRVRRRRADGEAVLVERRPVQLGDRRDVDAEVRWPERDALRRLAVHADRGVADDELDVVDGAVLAQHVEELGEVGDAQPGVAVLVDAESRADRCHADRDRHRLPAGDGRFLTGDDRAGHAALLVERPPVGGEVAHRVEDRAVARAPAEVAVEQLRDLLLRGVGIAVRREEAVHAHHPARRAVAALRAVVHGDPVLRRAQGGADAAEAFDGGDGHPVDRAQRPQARVHREVLDGVALALRERHRAGAAPALAARLLRAGQADLVRAEVVDEQRPRIGVVHDVRHVVHPEANRVTHRRTSASATVLRGARRTVTSDRSLRSLMGWSAGTGTSGRHAARVAPVLPPSRSPGS